MFNAYALANLLAHPKLVKGHQIQFLKFIQDNTNKLKSHYLSSNKSKTTPPEVLV